MDFPYLIELSPKLRMKHCTSVNVVYRAGYTHNNIPTDFSAACIELASWNMSRYKGRRGRTILFIFSICYKYFAMFAVQTATSTEWDNFRLIFFIV